MNQYDALASSASEGRSLLLLLFGVVVVFSLAFGLSYASFFISKSVLHFARTIYQQLLLNAYTDDALFLLTATIPFTLFYVIGRLVKTEQHITLFSALAACAAFAGTFAARLLVYGYAPYAPLGLSAGQSLEISLLLPLPDTCIITISSIGGYFAGLAGRLRRTANRDWRSGNQPASEVRGR